MQSQMGGTGVEQRMAILRSAADQQIAKPFRTHGWSAEITSAKDDGEYLVISAVKNGVTRRVALLYSSATDNRFYKKLDSEVDRTFTNGELYHPESFAYGLTNPVVPVDQFFPVLVAWNKELHPETPRTPARRRPSRVHVLMAENPLVSIWARLDQFASMSLAEKLVRRRAKEQSTNIPDENVRSKSAGVAFALRNASDYFRAVPFESLNKRILSLYYGTLALAFAEMLSSPSGPVDLDEIEGVTKFGHGFYTLGSGLRGFGDLGVGILATGFLPRWADFLGHDITAYPKAKPKSEDDVSKLPAHAFCTLRELLSAIPEISDLFAEVFDSEPSWILPMPDMEANQQSLFKQSALKSTYIKLVDRSGKIAQTRVENTGWPIAELSRVPDAPDGQVFRARVDHPESDHWFDALPCHQSPFENNGALILPPLRDFNEYRVVAMGVLYALLILVRYMPRTWRRVEGGDLDQHFALVKTAVGVFERILPQEFWNRSPESVSSRPNLGVSGVDVTSPRSHFTYRMTERFRSSGVNVLGRTGISWHLHLYPRPYSRAHIPSWRRRSVLDRSVQVLRLSVLSHPMRPFCLICLYRTANGSRA